MKYKLKYTWVTFFSRFGKLLPVQEKTIPIVLNDKNAIIVSPTASGKTEAVVVPLVEKMLEEKWNGLSITYVSPTKALVNDVYYRLHDQLKELGINSSIKTGDKPYFNPQKTPDILITTPESFDSILCRFPYALSDIKAVILDEIHLIDNTYRGDQIRILLKRLKRLANYNFNIYALSATIYDPIEVASRYMDDFETIVIPGKREIIYTLVDSIEKVYNYAIKERLKKILIFCNTRANVETIAKECKNLWDSNIVVVHHGSLSKQIREETENFMKQSRYGVCVATNTLELGIDIGDIDAVVLADVPWSLSSMLQRIGRANRRSTKCRTFAIFNSEEEKIILQSMFRVALNNNIEQKSYSPDLSVVVQQVFSSLFASPEGLYLDYFSEIFEDFCPSSKLTQIISHLAGEGWIDVKFNKLYPTTKLMDFSKSGQVHSNIPSNQTLKVIDVQSNKPIGEIQYPLDTPFILAGKAWIIVKTHNCKIYAKPAKLNGPVAKFKSHPEKGYFYDFLPEDLRTNEKIQSLNQRQ